MTSGAIGEIGVANGIKIVIIEYIMEIICLKKAWKGGDDMGKIFQNKRPFGAAKTKAISPTKIIALSFAVIIMVGTILLSLPIASRSGVSCGLRPAFFTATSATCVTGLTLFDTYSQWSGFGQIVMLLLIEIGGLGFMSAASLVIFMTGRKVGLRERMIMAQALSMTDIEGIVRLQKLVLFGSIGVQVTGAVVLFLRFLPDWGWWTALKWGVFHSVSAFCNAGFDIMGSIPGESSLSAFASDPVVLFTVSALVIMGGLGFPVWQEILSVHSFKKYSVYTKLVLLTSLVLLLTGMGMFCLLEWNNAATLGSMNLGDKLLNGFFQSVTVRSAGFAAIGQCELTDASKVLTMMMMLIGGSSGSTAGGVKTVTMVVLLLFILSRARGKASVCVFKRSIPATQVLDAMTIVSIVVMLAALGTVFIAATSPVCLQDALFESMAALTTGGIGTGVTERLSIAAQYLIIIYMYFGRVGVLTISLGFLMGNRAEDWFQYARAKILIG